MLPLHGVGAGEQSTAAAEQFRFEEFAQAGGERLRRALVARHGVDLGSDLAADALAYAWEHWARVAPMDNPVGYLYRVAQSASRRRKRWRRPSPFPPERPVELPEPSERSLPKALARLSLDQRTCVVLVHVFGWSYADVAEVLDAPISTVRNHVHRGLHNLRNLLEGK